MGCHGGLNILPQKRWNVYNRDAREKVEKDKLKQAELDKQKEQRTLHDASAFRIDILKLKKKTKPPEESGSNLNKELKEINESQQSERFKLFEEEENLLEAKAKIEKNIEFENEKKQKEDKFIEQTTMYLGQTIKNHDTPWYLKRQGDDKEEVNNNKHKNVHKPKIDLMLPENAFYKVLKLDDKSGKSHTKINSGDKDNVSVEQKREEALHNDDLKLNDKERKHKKEKKSKKHKKDRKHKKDKKEEMKKKHKSRDNDDSSAGSRSVSRSRSRSRSKEIAKSSKDAMSQEEKLAKLRMERLKREEAERKKAAQIIRKAFPI